MLAKIRSAALFGIDAYPVDVEVDLSPYGDKSFTVVGLPDAAVRESGKRVLGALSFPANFTLAAAMNPCPFI